MVQMHPPQLPLAQPVIDGQQATFYWQGESQPALVGDFNGWDFDHPLALRAASSSLWSAALTFPADAYMEYVFVVMGKRCLDPLNPRRVNNGTGSQNNYFYMPAGGPSPFAMSGRPRGELTRQRIIDRLRLLDGQREVLFYRPAAPGPYPLLVVYDGLDYLRRGRIALVVDRLIRASRIQPLALALVPNAGEGRFVEYACNDSTLSFILEQVIPLARRSLDLVDPVAHPGSYGVVGASMGGLMALYSALRASGVFGKVFSQAGAYKVFEQDFSIFDLIDRNPPPTIRIWQAIGRYDFLREANLRMARLLQQKGYALTLHESNGGHNFTTWRNELAEGLTSLFPFPS